MGSRIKKIHLVQFVQDKGMENNNIMVNLCLANEERKLLKDLIGKKLIQYRHDRLNIFGGETVYGKIEMFF